MRVREYRVWVLQFIRIVNLGLTDFFYSFMRKPIAQPNGLLTSLASHYLLTSQKGMPITKLRDFTTTVRIPHKSSKLTSLRQTITTFGQHPTL